MNEKKVRRKGKREEIERNAHEKMEGERIRDGK